MKNYFFHNIVSDSFRRAGSILDSGHKRKALFVLFFILFCAVLDVFGLAAILPVISIASDHAIIHTNVYLSRVYGILGFVSEVNFIAFILVSLFVFFVIKNFVVILINYYQANYSSDVATWLADRQFRYYFGREYVFFKEKKSTVLIHNIMNITTMFSIGILLPCITLLSEFLVVVLIVAGIAFYNINLFILMVSILAPAFFLIYSGTKNKMARTGEERKRYVPLALSQVTQAIRGYEDVKLSHKENFFLRKFIDYQRRLNHSSMVSYILNYIPNKTTELVAVFGMVLIFLYALFFTENTSDLFVMLGLFAAAAYRVMPSMNRMLAAVMNLKANHHTFEILAEANPDVQDDSGQKEIAFNNSIEFKNISFHFPDADELVLNNIHLRVAKGDAVGFIGKSGAGKTTLMKILLRFLKETSGQLLIDDVAVQQCHHRSWWSQIGYIKQDVFIVDGTLKENIAFGEEVHTIDEYNLQQAVVQSSLKDFVDKLPEGLNTQIGEMGARLSGGQKQRIEIARALYKSCGVFVFDEATSALDNETEREIVDSIEMLVKQKKTVFVIAHRYSTLKNCQKIYELALGQSTGPVSYQDLVSRSPQQTER